RRFHSRNPDLRSQSVDHLLGSCRIERDFTPEIIVWVDVAQDHISVRYGCDVAALVVTGRAWISAHRFWTAMHTASAVDPCHRSAARPNSMYIDEWDEDVPPLELAMGGGRVDRRR